MVVVPALIPVTNPELFIVATVELEEVQALVVAAVPLPVNCEELPIQTFNVPEMIGKGLTVKVMFRWQSLEFVYVIVVVPALIPVTKPVLSTVATAELEEVQAFEVAAVALPVNWEVFPTHAFNVPEIFGKGFTVIVAVVWQPLELVKVIIVVPGLTPVTNPEPFTIATAVLEELQGFVIAGVVFPVNCVVVLAQIIKFPVMVGNGFTVIVTVVWQPLELVYVIEVVPALTVVTKPVLSTVATAELDEVHALDEAAVALPVNWVEFPIHTFNVPVIVGNAFIVTVAVVWQPLELV